jgi:hypothetical protein
MGPETAAEPKGSGHMLSGAGLLKREGGAWMDISYGVEKVFEDDRPTVVLLENATWMEAKEFILARWEDMESHFNIIEYLVESAQSL